MKIKIIKSSELDSRCWSALRFTESCQQCPRCPHCKIEQAAIGRKHLAYQKLEKAKITVQKAKADYEKAKIELDKS